MGDEYAQLRQLIQETVGVSPEAPACGGLGGVAQAWVSRLLMGGVGRRWWPQIPVLGIWVWSTGVGLTQVSTSSEERREAGAGGLGEPDPLVF